MDPLKVPEPHANVHTLAELMNRLALADGNALQADREDYCGNEDWPRTHGWRYENGNAQGHEVELRDEHGNLAMDLRGNGNIRWQRM